MHDGIPPVKRSMVQPSCDPILDDLREGWRTPMGLWRVGLSLAALAFLLTSLLHVASANEMLVQHANIELKGPVPASDILGSYRLDTTLRIQCCTFNEKQHTYENAAPAKEHHHAHPDPSPGTGDYFIFTEHFAVLGQGNRLTATILAGT